MPQTIHKCAGLLVNQMKAQKFKKFFQVSTYLPHFIWLTSSPMITGSGNVTAMV